MRKRVSWEGFMIGAIGFLVAVGAISSICFVLITRAENTRPSRARTRGDSSYDGGTSSASDSWSFANWGLYFSSEASGNMTDSGACTTGSWDSGSSDSGGGGDCGGAGGGGSSD
jgi:hypothetical protein